MELKKLKSQKSENLFFIRLSTVRTLYENGINSEERGGGRSAYPCLGQSQKIHTDEVYNMVVNIFWSTFFAN